MATQKNKTKIKHKKHNKPKTTKVTRKRDVVQNGLNAAPALIKAVGDTANQIGTIVGMLTGGNNTTGRKVGDNDQQKAELAEKIKKMENEQTNQLKSMKSDHIKQMQQIKDDQKENIDKIQKIYDEQLTNQRHIMNEIRKDQKHEKEIYLKESEKQRRKQEQLENEMNKMHRQMREDRMKQEKEFAEKEAKIKRQLDTKIQKLNAENIKHQQEYEEKILKIQQINDKKLAQLEEKRNEDRKRYTDEMKQISKKNEENLKKLEINEVKNRIVQIEQVIHGKMELYKNKLRDTKVIFDEYKNELSQISNEKKRLQKFEPELTDSNLLNIVLIGITGHGKSTFACRLAGDNSLKCNSGLFKHNSDTVSVTQGIKKRICRGIWKYDISVVDTPGIFDSNNNDRHHANNLIEFLRGCGGVNAFILVKTRHPPRFDLSFQNVLSSLEVMLGKEFWKHVILVLTHTKDEDAVPCAFNQYANSLRENIYHQMNLKSCDGSLKCIGVDSFKNYKKPIKHLIDIIPKQRFKCGKLRSPLQELVLKNKNIKNKFNHSLNELNIIENDINLKHKEFQTANQILVDNGYKQKFIDLSIINKKRNQWVVADDDEKSQIY